MLRRLSILVVVVCCAAVWEGAGSVPDRPMLTAGQLAAAIVWAIGQPPGVDVNTLTIRPLGVPVA